MKIEIKRKKKKQLQSRGENQTKLRIAALRQFTNQIGHNIANMIAPDHSRKSSSVAKQTASDDAAVAFDAVGAANRVWTQLSAAVAPLAALFERNDNAALASVLDAIDVSPAVFNPTNKPLPIRANASLWSRITSTLHCLPLRPGVPPNARVVALIKSVGHTLSEELFGPRALFDGSFANANSALTRVLLLLFSKKKKQKRILFFRFKN